MNLAYGTRSERAFVDAIVSEIAGGRTQWDRNDVKTLVRCFRRECERFDALAMDIAYQRHRDAGFLGTKYGGFTKPIAEGKVEADVFGMRDQIDREDGHTGKDTDGT